MKDGDARGESEVAVFSLLERGFSQLPLSPAPHQISALTELVLLLEAWAGKINLTGHRNAFAMTRGLVLDAAAWPRCSRARPGRALPTWERAPASGLPLAILFQDVEFRLIDSRKRNHFQREVRRRLGLRNVHPVLPFERGRAPPLRPRPSSSDGSACRGPDPDGRMGGSGVVLALPGSDASIHPRSPTATGLPSSVGIGPRDETDDVCGWFHERSNVFESLSSTNRLRLCCQAGRPTAFSKGPSARKGSGDLRARPSTLESTRSIHDREPLSSPSSTRGGVGKATSAVNLGACLAASERPTSHRYGPAGQRQQRLWHRQRGTPDLRRLIDELPYFVRLRNGARNPASRRAEIS